MHAFSPRFALSVFAAGLVFASGAAKAGITTFSDAAAFAQAASSVTSYAFPAADNELEARPYTVGPLDISTWQHFTHPYLENDGAYGDGQTYLAMIGIPGVNVVIQPNVDGLYALGFKLGTFEGADTLSVTLNFDPNTVVASFDTSDGAGSSTFFGIVSSEPITQISFTAASGEEIDLLSFQATTISAVPEPASLSMLLAGAGLLGAVVRRRRKG